MDQMLRINLLDWRDARRELRKQQFFKALGGAAVVSAGIIFLVLQLYGSAIDQQQQRNRYLKDQITQVDKQIKEIKDLEKTRDNLITRMRIIEELQQSRAQIVHYFEQVVKTLPEGVFLTSLKQHGTDTTVNGVAESNGRVSSYMVNLDGSKWFNDPRLVVIKTNKKNLRRAADFTLTFKTVTPKENDPDQDSDQGSDDNNTGSKPTKAAR